MLFLAQISSEWQRLGVGGSTEDVDEVVNALTGKGIFLLVHAFVFTRCAHSFCLFDLSFHQMLVTWPHDQIKNLDVIRMHSVCELMQLCPRRSIYFVAINAMGEKTVRVNSYVKLGVRVLGLHTM